MRYKQKLLGKVSMKVPLKGLNELEGAPVLPAWNTDTLAGDPAATLDCKESLRVKISTDDDRGIKGHLVTLYCGAGMPALNCLFLQKPELQHRNTQSYTHRPSLSLRAAFVEGLPVTYSKSRNPNRNFWVLGKSTSHPITWSLPISLGPHKALTPRREGVIVIKKTGSGTSLVAQSESTCQCRGHGFNP